MTETLTCTNCNGTWDRERTRGRKPKRCPACVENPTRAVEPEPVPEPTPAKKKRRRRSKWERLRQDQPVRPDLATLPLASRTSGWCTDYDPVPEAVHDKCDGDLGKYRCPCECHEWPDL